MEDDFCMNSGSEEEDDYYPSDREEESPFDAQWNPSKPPSSKREDLREVMDLLSVREHHARTLLIHYRWDVEKLTTVYVEKGKFCMFTEAGVTLVEPFHCNPPVSSSTLLCNICMDDIPAKDVIKMDCGHSLEIETGDEVHFFNINIVEKVGSRTWDESNKMWEIAAPAILTAVAQFFIGFVTLAFVGHIEEVELVAVSVVQNVFEGFESKSKSKSQFEANNQLTFPTRSL